MSIIDRIPASVQADPGILDDGLDHFEPSQADLDDYGRWLASRDDLGHATEPTPVEVLDASAPLDGPRYEVRVAGLAEDPAGGYLAWDRAADCKVGWFRWFRDAQDACEDLNAEDFPPVVDGAGRPWYVSAPPCEHFDGPRVRLA